MCPPQFQSLATSFFNSSSSGNTHQDTSHSQTTTQGISNVSGRSGTPSLPMANANDVEVKKHIAVDAVEAILKSKKTVFHLVPFDKFKGGRHLRSPKYREFDVLCHLNTHKCAGFLVCRYLPTAKCATEKAVIAWNVKQGGTNVLQRHIDEHKQPGTQQKIPRSLSTSAKRSIITAAAYAVAQDMLPFSFAYKHKGMAGFAKSIFEAGQTYSIDDTIDVESSLMPSATAVQQEVTRQADSKRAEFKCFYELQNNGLQGGMSTDGVTLKLQDKHYFDLTLHYLHFSDPSDVNSIRMVCRTLLLSEAGKNKSADSIFMILNNALLRQYGFEIKALMPYFTLVTDWCAVMPNIVGASVSANVSPLDERWMGCAVHALNTAMKTCFARCERDVSLSRISADLKVVKNIVRIFKQAEWNGQLKGKPLIQEVETRFGSAYFVAKRFIHCYNEVKTFIEESNSQPAKESLIALMQDPTSDTVQLPALQAVVDTLSIIVDAQKYLEGSTYPTVHAVLPMLQSCKDELHRVAEGGLIECTNGSRCSPSALTRQLCVLMKTTLEDKIVVHDLWLAATFLNPLFREFQFVQCLQTRQEYRTRAETMVRKLVLASGISRLQSTPHNPTGGTPRPYQHCQPIAQDNGPSRKKLRLSLLKHADSHFPAPLLRRNDEVYDYLHIEVSTIIKDEVMFIHDEFAAVKFWAARKEQFPALFNVCCRVYATPVSSCASERVFSAVNRIVTRDRTKITSDALEDIIVLRSALSCSKRDK